MSDGPAASTASAITAAAPAMSPAFIRFPGQLCVSVGRTRLDSKLVAYEISRLGITRLATPPSSLDAFTPGMMLLRGVRLRDRQRGPCGGQMTQRVVAGQVVTGPTALGNVVDRSEQEG